MIDVSIIITTYNVERYIARAVESALGQTGVTLEVIIIDDCSTDNTWQIISQITDDRVRTRRNSQNMGPSIARNDGIAMAAGTWLAILDGDDAFLPGRLRRCIDRAVAHKADIIVDNVEIRGEADGKIAPMFRPAKVSHIKTIDLARFIDGNHLLAGGYSLGYLKPIFSADFLRHQNLAYDPQIRIGEDYMILAEALAKGAVCVVQPITGYAYTVRTGSISHRLSLNDIDDMIAADKTFLSRYRIEGDALKAQARRTASLKDAYAFTQLVEALKSKDTNAALKAICHRPLALRHLWRPVAVRLRKVFT